MSLKIAVAGKGGCGKTSVAALTIRYLMNNGKTPVLAVDADANSNLGESLGLELNGTIGGVLDLFQHEKIGIPPGMTKEAYLEIKLNGTIVESKNLDLVTMGRSQGPECYCYPNTILKKFIEDLASSYSCVVMDNEAGLEHLSRKTTENVDHLLLVSNHSVKGIRALARVKELVEEVKLNVKNQLVIVNMVPDGKLAAPVVSELEKYSLKPDVVIPEDEELVEFDLEQKPLTQLSDDSVAVKALKTTLDSVLL